MADYVINDQTFSNSVATLDATSTASAANLNAQIQGALDNTGWLNRMLETMSVKNLQPCYALTNGTITVQYLSACWDPTDNLFLVGTSGTKMYYSAMAGDSWSEANATVANVKFVTSDLVGNYVAAALNAGTSKIDIYHSTAPATAWSTIASMSTNTGAPGGMSAGNGRIIVSQAEASNSVIYWTTNRTSWTRVVVGAITHDPQMPRYFSTHSKWLLGHEDGRIYSSSDNGDTWTQRQGSLPGITFTDFAQCPNNDAGLTGYQNLVAVGSGLTSQTLYRSTDGGVTWASDTATGLTHALIRLISHGKWLIGISTSRVWYSYDNGKNWSFVFVGNEDGADTTAAKCLAGGETGQRFFVGGIGTAASPAELALVSLGGIG